MINLLKRTNVGTEIINKVLSTCDIDVNNIERIDNSIFYVDADGKRIKMCFTNDNQGVMFLIMDSEEELANNIAEFTISYGEYGFAMDGIAYCPNGKTIYLRSEDGGYIKCSLYNTEDIVKANGFDTDDDTKVSTIFNTTVEDNKKLNVPSDSCYLTYITLEDLSYIFRDFYQDQDTYSKLFGSDTLTF